MSQIQPPPTYAEVVLTGTDGKPFFNPIWLDWFITLAAVVSSSGGSTGTVQHNSTGGLQGGTANEYYHLTSAEHSTLQGWEGNQTAHAVLSGPVSGAAAAPSFQVLSLIAVKAAATTQTNNITLTNDPDLTFAIAASQTWVGRIYLVVTAAIKTTGIQVSVAAPTGATGSFSASIITDAASGQEVTVIPVVALGTAANFTAAALANANNGLLEIVFRVANSTTAGNVTLQWAQSTSSATSLSVRSASQLKADRVA